MSLVRKIVLIGSGLLLGLWLAGNFGWIRSDDDSMIRFVLGAILAAAIVLRPKPALEYARAPGWSLVAAAVTATLVAIFGIVFSFRQFEWIGLLGLVYACMRWALPPRFGRDTVLGLFMVYWIHPLPGQIFTGLQLTMQRLSVHGAEWLMNVLNVPAWAHGMVLYAGRFDFEVPTSCSGMTTSVTVLLCSLGTAILFRFRWYEIMIVAMAGMAQVLALNIARITHMAIAAPKMPPGWVENFLHDTLGVYLLTSILLVQFEVSLWRRWQVRRRTLTRGVAAGDVEPMEEATVLPGFWRSAARWGGLAILVILICSAGALAIYRHRPLHRAAMIGRIVADMTLRHPDLGEIAARRVLELDPGNSAMRREVAQTLMKRERYAESLEELGRIPRADWNFELDLLKAFALFKMKDPAGALSILDRLPGDVAGGPGVAMIRAEIYAAEDRVEDTVGELQKAARSIGLVQRVRALFPYLARREQWKVISELDADSPHVLPESAIIAVHAHIRSSNLIKAARALRLATRAWPEDGRFLDDIHLLAKLQPRGAWVEIFARNFNANVSLLPPDALANYIGRCFDLSRADLAWKAYARLHRLDPSDPGLDISVAEHMSQWWTMHRQNALLPASFPGETIDLVALGRAARGLAPFRLLWASIPVAVPMRREDWEAERAVRLAKCVEELGRRRAAGRMSARLRFALPAAYVLQARFDEAHAALDAIAAELPEASLSVKFRHAQYYATAQDWDNVYEVMRTYYDPLHTEGPAAALLLANALMRLGLGAYALNILENTMTTYPAVSQVVASMAGFWQQFGAEEMALHLIRKYGADYDPKYLMLLLSDTGRKADAEAVAHRFGIVDAPRPLSSERQYYVARPAEWSIARPAARSLSDEQRLALTASVEQQLAAARSPFVSRLHKLRLQWLRAGGKAALDVDSWTAAGRDDGERGAALCQLATLLAQEHRFEDAAAAAKSGLKYWPNSTVLWRLMVALTEGDRAVIDRARSARPTDPELWLAHIVVGFREKRSAEWMSREVKAVGDDRFPSETLVRAGDFLRRQRFVAPALLCAGQALARDDGYLPVDMLEVQSAMAATNRTLALAAALRGANRAVDPWPFHKAIVEIKNSQKDLDQKLVQSLEYMRARFTADAQWSEMLGYVYFTMGDNIRAFNVLAPAVSDPVRTDDPSIVLLAAEAARQSERDQTAVEILLRGRDKFPGDAQILNNLIYTLAESEAYVPLALKVLEEQLIPMVGDDAKFRGTAALVYLRAGKIERASTCMAAALAAATDKDASWIDLNIIAAEIMLKQGRLQEARAKIESVRSDKRRSGRADQLSLKLLREILTEEARVARKLRMEAVTKP